jgi:hypothetical protein
MSAKMKRREFITLLGGAPGPPRSPMRTGVSQSLTNSPQFAGVALPFAYNPATKMSP